ncbi:unnamed protein product [Caretta caretta]
MGLALREPELRLVLSAYADDVFLVVQDPDDLVWVEACQAVYSVASSARVSWVKSSGLVVGDGWQASSLPPALQAIWWSTGPLLYLSVYLSAMHPSPPENWQDLEARVAIEYLPLWMRAHTDASGCAEIWGVRTEHAMSYLRRESGLEEDG